MIPLESTQVTVKELGRSACFTEKYSSSIGHKLFVFVNIPALEINPALEIIKAAKLIAY